MIGPSGLDRFAVTTGPYWSEVGSSDVNFEEYHAFLQKRSRFALLYRRWYLYPVICRYLSGCVLDIGCGIGDFLAYRPDTVGVDVNPLLVEHCRKNGLEAHWVRTLPMPFAERSFAGAVMDNVLEHLEEPHEMIEEARRILMFKGTLVIGVPGRKGFASDPDHKHFYDETRLRTDLTSYRFHCEKVWHLPVRAPQLDRYFSQFALYGIFRRID